jgi:hypothetical protein
MGLRQAQELRHRLGEEGDRPLGVVGDEQREVGRHLVVARAAGVELAADGAGDLGEPALHRHVDVLVGRLIGERVALELSLDGIESGEDLLELRGVEDAGAEQGLRVGPRPLDVVGGEPAVERQRGVELPEGRIGWAFESRHGGGV